MTVTIYTLSDPESGRVRYVGKTKHPRKRLRQHLMDARNLHLNGNGRRKINKRYAWIISLLVRSKEPVFTYLEEVDCSVYPEAWVTRERYWIDHFQGEVGSELLNMTPGGDGGATNEGKKFGPPTQEKRRKISETLRETYKDPKNKWGCRLGGLTARGRHYSSEVVRKRASALSATHSSKSPLERLKPWRGFEIKCVDSLTGNTRILSSTGQAALELGIRPRTVWQAIKRGNKCFDRYLFSYSLRGTHHG